MLSYEIKHNSEAKIALEKLCKKHGCIKKASTAFFKQLNEDTQAKIQKILEEISFHRRRYGRSDWYCWAEHKIFTESPLDPWPAVRFPKSVLIADIAVRTDIVKL